LRGDKVITKKAVCSFFGPPSIWLRASAVIGSAIRPSTSVPVMYSSFIGFNLAGWLQGTSKGISSHVTDLVLCEIFFCLLLNALIIRIIRQLCTSLFTGNG